jgi:hypothetical protein
MTDKPAPLSPALPPITEGREANAIDSSPVTVSGGRDQKREGVAHFVREWSMANIFKFAKSDFKQYFIQDF